MTSEDIKHQLIITPYFPTPFALPLTSLPTSTLPPTSLPLSPCPLHPYPLRPCPLLPKTNALSTDHGLLFSLADQSPKGKQLSLKYSTLHKSPFKNCWVCKAAFRSKKKSVVFFNPLKGYGLDLHVKDKVTHRMKCIKLLDEFPDVTGPAVR